MGVLAAGSGLCSAGLVFAPSTVEAGIADGCCSTEVAGFSKLSTELPPIALTTSRQSQADAIGLLDGGSRFEGVARATLRATTLRSTVELATGSCCCAAGSPSRVTWGGASSSTGGTPFATVAIARVDVAVATTFVLDAAPTLRRP